MGVLLREPPSGCTTGDSCTEQRFGPNWVPSAPLRARMGPSRVWVGPPGPVRDRPGPGSLSSWICPSGLVHWELLTDGVAPSSSLDGPLEDPSGGGLGWSLSHSFGSISSGVLWSGDARFAHVRPSDGSFSFEESVPTPGPFLREPGRRLPQGPPHESLGVHLLVWSLGTAPKRWVRSLLVRGSPTRHVSTGVSFGSLPRSLSGDHTGGRRQVFSFGSTPRWPSRNHRFRRYRQISDQIRESLATRLAPEGNRRRHRRRNGASSVRSRYSSSVDKTGSGRVSADASQATALSTAGPRTRRWPCTGLAPPRT
jgi:hypothetical protein